MDTLVYILLITILCHSIYPTSIAYNVTVIEVDQNPVASYIDNTSKYWEVWNPAVVVSSDTVNTGGLLIRTMNCTLPIGNCNHTNCAGTGTNTSILTFVHCDFVNGTCSNSIANPINVQNVVFGPISYIDMYGTEDPRIVYNEQDGYYYLFYTSYGVETENATKKTVLLSLAKSKYPNKNDSWIRYGAIFNPPVSPSKSGALILSTNTDELNYLYWFGNPCIYITNSTEITKWNNTGKRFICPRQNGFDAKLTESGPPPIKLWDGNYLFLYNSATNGWPKQQNASYNVGFVIIDSKNKSLILQRSELNEALLSPTMAWDIGLYPYTCNHHNVVFVEGAYKLNESQKREYLQTHDLGTNQSYVSDMDLIRIFFGGSDAVTGTAMIQISYQ